MEVSFASVVPPEAPKNRAVAPPPPPPPTPPAAAPSAPLSDGEIRISFEDDETT
jgi:hypothetical protein